MLNLRRLTVSKDTELVLGGFTLTAKHDVSNNLTFYPFMAFFVPKSETNKDVSVDARNSTPIEGQDLYVVLLYVSFEQLKFKIGIRHIDNLDLQLYESKYAYDLVKQFSVKRLEDVGEFTRSSKRQQGNQSAKDGDKKQSTEIDAVLAIMYDKSCNKILRVGASAREPLKQMHQQDPIYIRVQSIVNQMTISQSKVIVQVRDPRTADFRLEAIESPIIMNFLRGIILSQVNQLHQASDFEFLLFADLQNNLHFLIESSSGDYFYLSFKDRPTAPKL